MITKIEKGLVLAIILYGNWFQYLYRSGIALTGLTILLLMVIAFDMLCCGNEKVLLLKPNMDMLYAFFLLAASAFVSGIFIAPDVAHMLTSLIQYVSFSVLCVACYYIAEKEKSMAWFMNEFMICALVCSLYTIFFGVSYHTAGVDVTTISETNNPNHLALTILIGVYAVVSDYEKVKKNFVFSLIAVLICAYTIVLSGSKKALLSLPVILVFWSMIYFAGEGKDKRKKTAITTKKLFRTIIVVVGIIVVATYLTGTFKESSAFVKLERMFTDVSTEDARTDLYVEGWQFFLEKPIFGIGFRQFENMSSSGLYSHSTYIEILSCTGIVGAIIFFIPILKMLFLFLKKSFLKAQEGSYAVRLFLVFLLVELFYFSVQIAVYELNHMLILTYFTWQYAKLTEKRMVSENS